MKNFIKIILFLFLTSLVSSCATTKKGESVHGKGPLIKTSDVVVKGRKDMDEMVKAGPKPYDPDFDIREGKRKTITTETVRNYVSISRIIETLNKM